MLTRRSLILTTAPAALALAGCATSGGTTTFNVSNFSAAIQAIAAEVGQIIPTIAGVTSIPAATVSEIQSIVAEIQQVAAGVGQVSTATAGQSLLTTIEGYINDLAPIVLPLLSAIPGIGSVASILGIIVAALPAIEAMVGIVITDLTSTAQSLATAAPAVPTTSGKFRAAFGQNSQYYLNLLVHRASGRLHSRYR